MPEAMLCIVEDTFALSGRSGIIIVPGVEAHCRLAVKVGDPLLLRRPDGVELQTHVAGLGIISRHDVPLGPQSIPILLGPGLGKDMVSVGTRVFVLEPRYIEQIGNS